MTIEHPRRLHKLWAGWMIPPRVVESFPGWLIAEIGDQVIWKWLAVIVILVVMLFITWKVHRRARRVMKDTSMGRHLHPLVAPAGFLLMMFVVEYLVRVQVGITGVATDVVETLFPALTYLAMAWLIWQGALFIAEAIILSPRISDQGLDAHLLRLLARVVGLAGILGVLFWGGNRLGLPQAVRERKLPREHQHLCRPGGADRGRLPLRKRCRNRGGHRPALDPPAFSRPDPDYGSQC